MYKIDSLKNKQVILIEKQMQIKNGNMNFCDPEYI